MKKLLTATAALSIAMTAMAYPTTVKLLKEPDLASSKGAQAIVRTSKGTIAVSSKYPAYQQLAKVKAGQCLVLETFSESYVEFNKKVDQSGVASAEVTKC